MQSNGTISILVLLPGLICIDSKLDMTWPSQRTTMMQQLQLMVIMIGRGLVTRRGNVIDSACLWLVLLEGLLEVKRVVFWLVAMAHCFLVAHGFTRTSREKRCGVENIGNTQALSQS